MSSEALNSKITLEMVVKNAFSKFKDLLAGTMSTKEKLEAVTEKMREEVQQLRVQARQIGAQMRALADPETAEKEPLEAMRERRAKLVKLAGQNLDNPEMLGQIQVEIKALEGTLAVNEKTYAILQQNYGLSTKTYKEALANLEMLETQAPAVLAAMEAQDNALRMRDSMMTGSDTDVLGIMNQLNTELAQKSAELRTDREIDADLDASKPGSINDALADMDAKSIDAALMAEFRAAAAAENEPAA